MNHQIHSCPSRAARLTALVCTLALLICALPLTAFPTLAAGGDRTIERMPSAPTIDGVLSDGEWGDAAMPLQNYQTATIPGEGQKVPLEGDVYLSYDSGHFYLAVAAQYDSHQNAYTDYDLWRGDALQIQLSADGLDRRSFCFGLGDDGTVRGYQSGDHRETYTLTAPGGEFFVARDEESGVTVYEIALPLSRFSDTVTALNEGGSLRFSFAMHMHNGYYYEWCGGIVLEKNLRQAATLTLGELRQADDSGAPAARTVWVGDADGDGDRNTTDARLALQYAARRIPETALDLDAADVDGSGAVDTTDARLMLQYAARRINSFPRGETVTVQDGDMPSGGGRTVSSNTFSPVSTAAGTPFATLEQLQSESGGGTFSYFAFTTEANEGLPFNVNCAEQDGMLTAMLPAGTACGALIPTFACPGFTVQADGAPLTSDVTALNLTEDVTLTLSAVDGRVQTLTLRVETLDTGLPSLALTTEGYEEIVSKEEYLNASVYLGGGGESASLRTATVKGRGNSSWMEPKKGYTVKLATKESLLGMSTSKDWALIANYEDKTLLRNTMAEYLAEGAGLNYVMHNRPVDLWYNGVYWGTYTLTEKIEIEKDRVNITKYEAGCGTGQTGFLLEFDGHVTEVPDAQRAAWQRPLGSGVELYYDPATDDVFMPVGIGGKWVTIKKPSYATLTESNDLAQLRYIYDKVNAAVDALRSGDYTRIEQCLDVTSFVKWYLVEEYMNNGDSSFHSSCYMTLDIGGKFQLGPVWDFDRSSANCDYWNPGEAVDSLYTSGSAWFYLLFEHAEARAILKTEYDSFRETLLTLPDYLEQQADAIYASQKYNFERWDILETVIDDNINQQPNAITAEQQNAQTFEAEICRLEKYFLRRTAQMDTFIPFLA